MTLVARQRPTVGNAAGPPEAATVPDSQKYDGYRPWQPPVGHQWPTVGVVSGPREAHHRADMVGCHRLESRRQTAKSTMVRPWQPPVAHHRHC